MPKAIGAPSQHSQPSRKGKKAWRKNVDIGEIEEGLESLRDEERTTGTQLHKTTDDQLFQIDIKGDDKLKRVLPKYDRSQLMSTKVLSQRSAIPPVFSRASKPVRSGITREEKTRLLRMGKRKVKGPFNAIVDPTELGAGSALLDPTEAVLKSGTFDVWGNSRQSLALGKGNYKDPEDFLLPFISKPRIKAPKSLRPDKNIDLPAIVQPHQGISYNPLETAHKELLLNAHEIEVRRETEAAKYEGVKERMESARRAVVDEIESGAPGMLIDYEDAPPIGENNNDEDSDHIAPAPKAPLRKTQKQKRKAAQILAEKRAVLDQRRRKRFLATLSSAKSLRSLAARSSSARQAKLEALRVARAERLRQRGLIGQKLGKHRIQEGQVDVQLGEELSETLRELKPQGNLFRDRFLSLQHRALVEPRVPVLPKRRRTKTKEYEKHAWKRFDRE